MNSKLRNLSISEKIQLVEDLWDSIASEQEAMILTQEQKSELDDRLITFDIDGNIGRPFEKALDEIRQKL